MPGAPSTHVRRLKVIRSIHQEARLSLDIPTRAIPTATRIGGEWASIPLALAHTTKQRFPVGVRGRRDAFLLVLIGTLGLSRSEARSIHQSDIQLFPEVTIRGVTIPKSEKARECPRCAVTRWLRIVNLAAFGARADLGVILDPTLNLDIHDCLTGLNGDWRYAPVLMASVDRHGWLDNTAPLSLRSISSIMARCQGAPGPVEEEWVPKEYTGRFKDATNSDLADAYDDVDEKLTELLERINNAVGESDDLLGHINEIG